MVYDGVGLTTVACDRMTELIDKANERLDQCGCETDDGCFRCIANPLSNEATSKRATRVILNRLCDDLAGKCKVTENESESTFDDVLATKPCATCETPVKTGDRFCSNCGEKQDN